MRNTQRGISLVEIAMAVTLLVVLLGSIAGINQMLTRELSANDAVASATEVCRIVGQRMTNQARPGCLSTCLTQATQEDVDAALAAQMLDPEVVVPALGDWISFPQHAKRSTLRFRAADGVLSLNATALTPPRVFEFVLDVNELDNDADDDDDGLIDEGSVRLREDTTLLYSCTDIENCTFELSGSKLVFELKVARRNAEGRVYRSNSVQEIYMRNR